MPDNIVLNPGSGGATLATDEAGTPLRHFQYVKLADGTPDSTAAIVGDSTFGLDVDVTRLPADTLFSGNISAIGAAVEANTDRGEGALGVQITGTWAATLAFEGRVDTTAAWQPIQVWDVVNRQLVSQTTSNGLYAASVAHLNTVRVVASAFTSGTATVTFLATRGAVAVPAEVQPVSGTVGATQSGSWSVTADTELPTAAALADGAANPTTPTVGSATLAFNGTTWDRVRGDVTNGLDVDVTRVQGNVTVVQPTAANLNATVTGTVGAAQSGSWSVTADTELPAAAALADGAANPTAPTVGAAGLVFNGTTWDRARGDVTNGLDVDVTRVQGNVTVVQATAANLNATVTGTVNAAQSGAWNVTADTELPAAAALADDAANPTTPTVGAATLVFDGTAWDRARGDTANGLDVDVTRVQGTVATNLAQIGGTAQSGANVVDTTNSALRVNVVAGGGSGGTSSSFDAAFPATGTAAGYSDGTNMRSARVFDTDTGAGTQFVLGVNLRQSASGGSVEAGTASTPLRIDPTGTTTQPVSGTVTANQGGSWSVDTELPAAAALADAAANPTTPTVGAATLVFNGTTWDRARGDTTNGLDVDVTRVQGTVATNLAQIGGTAQSGANVVDTTNSALRVNVVAGGGSGGTSSNFGAAFPGTGTAAGYSDGTNMQGARVFDLDTGAGTQFVLGVNLRQAASGGSVELGTSSTPLRVDPTGTTTQPVSGSVTADTELPAAAALADGAANPTTPTVGSATLAFNGTTWDRVRGDATNGLDVDVTRLPADTLFSGTIAALDAAVEANTDRGEGALGVQIKGTWTATLAFEGRVDTTAAWQPIQVWDVVNRQLVSQTTSNGLYAISVAHLNTVRVVASAFTSGTATVTFLATRGAVAVPAEVQPISGTVGATQSGSWSVTADTELPAAAALADGAANPTTPMVGASTLAFNGTSWDRVRGDTTNGLDVDVTRVQGNVTVVQATAANLNATVTGTVNATQSGTWTVVDGGAGKTLKRAVVSLTATGTVIAAVSGRRLKVYQYAIQSRNDGMTARFRDGTAGSNLGLEWSLNTREGVSSGPVNPPAFLFATTAGNSLDAVLSGTGTVWIEVSYWDDDTA